MSTPSSIVNILACQKRIAGQVPYSESASTRLTSDPAHELTATDCSGMAHRMFMRYAGVDIGTYTGNEKYHGTLVTQSKSAARAGYGMLPGDLIFFDWDGGGIDHVAIYAGGGRIWNHGGPGYGPLDWSLQNNVDNAVAVMVRRYIAPATTAPDTSVTTQEVEMLDPTDPLVIAINKRFDKIDNRLTALFGVDVNDDHKADLTGTVQGAVKYTVPSLLKPIEERLAAIEAKLP